MAPARTVTLTERLPHCCRLRPDDVAFLLAHHREHLELMPAAGRGRWQLVARGKVGVIVAPGCRLVIRPKIALENVFYFVSPTASVRAAAGDRVTARLGEAVLDFLAGQFALRLAQRLMVGLHRGYRERSERGPYLVGALDLPAQLREGPGRKDQLHSRLDDFTADVPCNQALRAVVEQLLASPLLGEEVRARLRACLPGLEQVQAWRPSALEWERLRAGRLPEDYSLLLELARLLVDGLAPGEAAGPTPAPAFLLDMERVWERHVTRIAVGAFAEGPATVAVQTAFTAGRCAEGEAMVVRPDVVVSWDGEAALVVDAKWKRPGRGPAAEDLYQVLAYATTLGAPRAVLVYPGRRDRARQYVFAHTPIRLTVWTLRADGTPDDCARSARRLAEALRGMAK